MNELPQPEHWFDRLAAGLTRRAALKAAVAAAAAITLPVMRSSSASADIHTDPCFTGCRWFEHKQFGAARQRCDELDAATRMSAGLSLLTTTLTFSGAPAATLVANFLAVLRRYHTCIDTAITNAKVASFDCYGPACSGFDPEQAGGPCDSCSENCCVCPDIPVGYICCFYTCDDPDHNCCGS